MKRVENGEGLPYRVGIRGQWCVSNGYGSVKSIYTSVRAILHERLNLVYVCNIVHIIRIKRRFPLCAHIAVRTEKKMKIFRLDLKLKGLSEIFFKSKLLTLIPDRTALEDSFGFKEKSRSL